jgi:hypothetical protein
MLGQEEFWANDVDYVLLSLLLMAFLEYLGILLQFLIIYLNVIQFISLISIFYANAISSADIGTLEKASKVDNKIELYLFSFLRYSSTLVNSFKQVNKELTAKFHIIAIDLHNSNKV